MLCFAYSLTLCKIFKLQGINLARRGSNRQELNDVANLLIQLLSTCEQNGATNNEKAVNLIEKSPLMSRVIYNPIRVDSQDITSQTSSPPPSSISVSSRLKIKMKELSNLTKVGQGSQGTVYRAEWRGIIVVYKQMKMVTDSGDKKEFLREFNIWQYVKNLFLMYSSVNWFTVDMQHTIRVLYYMGLWMKEVNLGSLLSFASMGACI